MSSKAEVFNLTLNMLLLEKEIADPDSDNTREGRILRRLYPVALAKTLEDLDLDCTATIAALELISSEVESDFWKFSYKYPSKCVFFRRIESCHRTDTRDSQIPHAVSMIGAQKVIYTNQEEAFGQYISSEVPLVALPYSAILALSANLAMLASSLVVGKGAAVLRKEIRDAYTLYKAEAQELDVRENMVLESPQTQSEFAAARLE